MTTQPPFGSRADFLAHLQKLSADRSRVGHLQIHTLLEQLPPEGGFLPTEWGQVVDFSASQLCDWHVEWLFSQVESPDAVAADEYKGWQKLWNVYADGLAEHVPAGKALVREHCAMLEVSRVLERSLQYRRTRPLVMRLGSGFLFATGKVLGRLRLRRIGEELVTLAMFPPGTVGRVA